MMRMDFVGLLLLCFVCLVVWTFIGYRYGHHEGRLIGYRQCLGEQDDDK